MSDRRTVFMKALWKTVIFQQVCWCLVILWGGSWNDQENVIHVMDGLAPTQSRDLQEVNAAPTYVNDIQPPLTDWDPRKPSLIIHIGPSKTGTTSIQKESLTFADALAQDNYIYLGRYQDHTLREPAHIGAFIYKDACFQKSSDAFSKNETTDFRETPCWKSRISRLDEYRQNGTSIVLSDEAYSYNIRYTENWDQHHFQMLKAAFSDWNVLVVPTYRRYYEWILSVKKEQNDKRCSKQVWPREGGKRCDNLWDSVMGMNRRNDYTGIHYGNLDRTLPAWQSGGFNTRVLNFHSPQHITCSFYCHMLPDTPHTCQSCLQHATGGKFNAKTAAMTAYNDIVYQAARRGLITAEMQDNQLRYNATLELAERHHYAGLDQLPLKCPVRQDMASILEKSLAFERMILPQWAALPGVAQDHTQEFWKRTSEYCTVDTDALLNDVSSWEEVLDNLSQPQDWPVREMEPNELAQKATS